MSSCLVPPLEVPTGRLGSGVAPTHYTLELHVDPEKERFHGTVRIALEIRAPQQRLWLHAKGLDVSSAVVVGNDGRTQAASFDIVHDSGVAALQFDDEIGAGNAYVEIAWDADYTKGLRGLYKIEAGGDPYLFTQFEAISARHVFPSFDEPAFKATFDVSIVAPSSDVVLGNTPETASQDLPASDAFPEGRVRHTFATTPPLPTYLLAWAVGPLDVVDAEPIAPNEVRSHAVPLRGVAPRGRGPELAYALERTGDMLVALERYVGSAYPFAKLDIVAVPDFAAGAMENVGLITFRDWLLLVDPETAPEGQRRAFASVMTHELAHQWFGNSVTMPWWDDIWLNESFATWMAAGITSSLYPEHRSDIHALNGAYYAMAGDALASARRIREPITSTHDIRNAFDGITYQKGGAVLGMVEAAVGHEEFRAAIRKYLERHRFGLATADDFLAVIESELGTEWDEVFRSFLGQAGVPFLEVQTQCGEGRRVRVGQSRYRPLGSSLAVAEASWTIPFCSRGDGPATQCEILRSAQSQLSAPTCGAFFHPNAGGRGYYRWSLDGATLTELRENGLEAMTVREKMSLSDALQAGLATGALDAGSVYGALEPLARDDERYVASSTFGLVRFAKERLATNETDRVRVMMWAQRLFSERARALGFDAASDEDGEARLLRSQMVRFATTVARDPELRAEAARRGRQYLQGAAGTPDDSAAASELLGLISKVAVREGGPEEFEAALAHLAASDDSTVRGHMLDALGDSNDPALAERARELLFDDRLRANERFEILRAHASRVQTREDAWLWVQRRFDDVVERVTRQHAARLLSSAQGFCSEAKAHAVSAFFAEGIAELEGGPRRLASATEGIRLCAASVERHRAQARAFFESEVSVVEVR